MLHKRLWRTGREQAHPVLKDGGADDFKREEDAAGKVRRGLNSGFFICD